LFFLSSSNLLSLSPPAEQTQPENEFIPQIEMVFVFYTYIFPHLSARVSVLCSIVTILFRL
jgi:hypothetical protein